MKKVTSYTLSVLRVPRQLKMSNLDCWGQGESIDTHIVGVCDKGDKDLCIPSVSQFRVSSQLIMVNLDCCGAKELIHYLIHL